MLNLCFQCLLWALKHSNSNMEWHFIKSSRIINWRKWDNSTFKKIQLKNKAAQRSDLKNLGRQSAVNKSFKIYLLLPKCHHSCQALSDSQWVWSKQLVFWVVVYPCSPQCMILLKPIAQQLWSWCNSSIHQMSIFSNLV